MSHEEYSSETIHRYQKRFKKFGVSKETLGWYKGNQDIRYSSLLKHIPTKDLRIIEVGCGFGDGIPFLRKNHQVKSYHGIDIVPEFIEIARECFQNEIIDFTCGNFLDLNIKDKFDLAIASGIFNFNEKHVCNYQMMEEFIKFSIQRRVRFIAFDCLSYNCDKKNKDNFYPQISKLVKILNKYSRRHLIDHTFLPFEIGISIFLDNEIDFSNSSFAVNIK